MIVKTSDDSLCPFCRDCSLIKLAAEILHPWVKMRIAFPLLHLLLLLFLFDIFRCWWDEISWFLLSMIQKRLDRHSVPAKKKRGKSPPPCYPRTFCIPLSASCLIKISPLATFLTICLVFGFFYPQVLNVGPKNISPSLSSAFHLTIFFPMQAEIIGMWLIKAGGGRQEGMTVNQPFQGCVLPAVMCGSTMYHNPQADFYLRRSGGSLVLSHLPCQSVSRAQIQPRASVEWHPLFSPCPFLSQPLWNVQKVIFWLFNKARGIPPQLFLLLLSGLGHI